MEKVTPSDVRAQLELLGYYNVPDKLVYEFLDEIAGINKSEAPKQIPSAFECVTEFDPHTRGVDDLLRDINKATESENGNISTFHPDDGHAIFGGAYSDVDFLDAVTEAYHSEHKTQVPSPALPKCPIEQHTHELTLSPATGGALGRILSGSVSPQRGDPCSTQSHVTPSLKSGVSAARTTKSLSTPSPPSYPGNHSQTAPYLSGNDSSGSEDDPGMHLPHTTLSNDKIERSPARNDVLPVNGDIVQTSSRDVCVRRNGGLWSDAPDEGDNLIWQRPARTEHTQQAPRSKPNAWDLEALAAELLEEEKLSLALSPSKRTAHQPRPVDTDYTFESDSRVTSRGDCETGRYPPAFMSPTATAVMASTVDCRHIAPAETHEPCGSSNVMETMESPQRGNRCEEEEERKTPRASPFSKWQRQLMQSAAPQEPPVRSGRKTARPLPAKRKSTHSHRRIDDHSKENTVPLNTGKPKPKRATVGLAEPRRPLSARAINPKTTGHGSQSTAHLRRPASSRGRERVVDVAENSVRPKSAQAKISANVTRVQRKRRTRDLTTDSEVSSSEELQFRRDISLHNRRIRRVGDPTVADPSSGQGSGVPLSNISGARQEAEHTGLPSAAELDLTFGPLSDPEFTEAPDVAHVPSRPHTARASRPSDAYDEATSSCSEDFSKETFRQAYRQGDSEGNWAESKAENVGAVKRYAGDKEHVRKEPQDLNDKRTPEKQVVRPKTARPLPPRRKKFDPVSRYQKMQEVWRADTFLRGNRRKKPEPSTVTREYPAHTNARNLWERLPTYVIPSDKRRDSLRRNVRRQMAVVDD